MACHTPPQRNKGKW